MEIKQINNLIFRNWPLLLVDYICVFFSFFFRVILPIMQSYSYAGDFTVRGKIKTAMYENALWYASYLVIFGLLLIYVILKPELKLDG